MKSNQLALQFKLVFFSQLQMGRGSADPDLSWSYQDISGTFQAAFFVLFRPQGLPCNYQNHGHNFCF